MIKENQNLLNKVNAFSDIAILFLSMILAYMIRFYIFAPGTYYIKLNVYLEFTILVVPLNSLLYIFLNLYDPIRKQKFYIECISVFKANTMLIAILLSSLYIFRFIHISRLVVIIFYFVNTSLTILKRGMLRRMLSSIRSRGLNLKHVLIVGSGDTALEYLNVINSNKTYGYNYAGYVSNSVRFPGNKLGDYKDLFNILYQYKFDEVVCALNLEDSNYLEQIVSDCEKSGTKLSIIPFCYKYIPSQPYIDQIGNLPLINVRRIPLDNLGNAFLKRTMDIILSLVLIILTSPIMIITGLIIKTTSKGPIIFKQKRVGLNKKVFTMYKFRSMKLNNDENKIWSTNNDSRKTPFGSFIRKFSIDELPQFFNVLKGDMSIVGPRPELPHFVDEFKDEIPLYMVKHQVKPGITGLAQVKGFRGDTSIKRRIEFDIYYIENWNIFMDIGIIIKTAFKGLRNDEIIVSSKTQFN